MALLKWLPLRLRRLFARRDFKDRFFNRCFRDKKDLLSLYNAANHSHYTDERQLEVTTLEDGIYMSMKNDTSFIIASDMCLYEHQSTYNPNMPLRGLLYFARLYEAYVEKNKLDVYGSKKLTLPRPRFIVFFNGDKNVPDVSILKLSDLYKQDERADGSQNEGVEALQDEGYADSLAEYLKTPALECTAIMLNINYGHNEELMRACRRLHDYAYFVNLIKEGIAEGLELKVAIRAAMDECIEQGVLEDILRKNRGEVFDMILTEFDEKAYKKRLYNDGREDGIQLGRQEGMELGLNRGRQEGRREGEIRALYYVAGFSVEEIAEKLGQDISFVEEVLHDTD